MTRPPRLLLVALVTLVTLLALGALVGCKPDVVASIELPGPEVEAEARLTLEAGRRYFLVADHDYDTDGRVRGPERVHCYQWRLTVESEDDEEVASITCPAFFMRWDGASTCRGLTVRAGGRRAGSSCMMEHCGFTATKSGRATLRGRLEETSRCAESQPSFRNDLKATTLSVGLARAKR